MADRRENLRAADVDRQFVSERLKAALDEGRLSLGEYDDRLKETYAARTYGDLDRILDDLPGFHPVGDSELMPAEPINPEPVTTRRTRDRSKRNPQWLVGIWSAWLVAVSVNVVIWALVSLSDGEAAYFWPMWVAGPAGAVLLATTFSMRVLGNSPDETQKRYSETQKRYRDS